MIRKFFPVAILSIFVLLSAGGCACKYGNQPYVWDGNLVPVSYSIADSLESNLRTPLAREDTLLVASFVNVDDLGQSSTFGRMIAEQVASRFAQKGYSIHEMKLRQDSVFIQEGKGEFLLSRDLRDISVQYNASAVVVGTYAESNDRVYVTARIVRPADSVVIASHDVGIPMDGRTMSLVLRSDR